MFVFLSFCLQNDLPKASTCASSVSGARLSFGLSPDFPNPLGTLTEHQCKHVYVSHVYTIYKIYEENGTLKPHEGVFSTRGKQSATRFALQRGSSGNCLEIEKPAVHLAVNDVCHIPAQGPFR